MVAFDLLTRVKTFITVFHAVTRGLWWMNVQLSTFSRQDGITHNLRCWNSVNWSCLLSWKRQMIYNTRKRNRSQELVTKRPSAILNPLILKNWSLIDQWYSTVYKMYLSIKNCQYGNTAVTETNWIDRNCKKIRNIFQYI